MKWKRIIFTSFCLVFSSVFLYKRLPLVIYTFGWTRQTVFSIASSDLSCNFVDVSRRYFVYPRTRSSQLTLVIRCFLFLLSQREKRVFCEYSLIHNSIHIRLKSRLTWSYYIQVLVYRRFLCFVVDGIGKALRFYTFCNPRTDDTRVFFEIVLVEYRRCF